MQRFEDGVCGELVIVRCLFVEDGRWATMVCFVCFLRKPAGGLVARHEGGVRVSCFAANSNPLNT